MNVKLKRQKKELSDRVGTMFCAVGNESNIVMRTLDGNFVGLTQNPGHPIDKKHVVPSAWEEFHGTLVED